MNRTPILVLGILFVTNSAIHAQDLSPTHGEQLDAMKKLKPLLGEWTGSGWIKMGPRRFEFESSEVFSEKAGGMAIIVEGIHRMPLPNGQKHVVHNAVAMITYDADGDHYRFISQLANGRGGDYKGTLTEDGEFRWVIPDTPVGKMVYTISIGDGEYSEIGELTTPGSEKRKFFEMKLSAKTP